MALGAGGREVIGSGGGPAVVLAAGAAVAAWLVGLVLADLVTDFEHALTMAAAPAPPASPSSRRRLTTSGPPSGLSGAGKSMMDTIRRSPLRHRRAVESGAKHAEIDDAADQFAGGLVGIRLVYFVQPIALGDHLIEQ